MSDPAIFCLAPSRGRADRIIHELRGAEFAPADIGALFFDRDANNDFAHERDPRALTAAAAESAGPIRGVLTWIAGIGRFVVPGVGSCIGAGPIVAALHPARNGARGGTIARGLTGLGVSAAEAARYEQRLKTDGHILLSVHSANPNKILRARAIFAESNAQEICTIEGTSTPPVAPDLAESIRPV